MNELWMPRSYNRIRSHMEREETHKTKGLFRAQRDNSLSLTITMPLNWKWLSDRFVSSWLLDPTGYYQFQNLLICFLTRAWEYESILSLKILPIDNIMPAVLGLGTPIKIRRLNPKSLFKMVSSCSDNHLWSVIKASGNKKAHFLL